MTQTLQQAPLGDPPRGDRALSLSIQLEARSGRINAVNEIAATMNRSLKLDDILLVIKQQAKWLLDFHYCTICLCGDDSTQQTILLFGEAHQEQTLTESTTILDRVIATKQPQLIQGRQLASSSSLLVSHAH